MATIVDRLGFEVKQGRFGVFPLNNRLWIGIVGSVGGGQVWMRFRNAAAQASETFLAVDESRGLVPDLVLVAEDHIDASIRDDFAGLLAGDSAIPSVLKGKPDPVKDVYVTVCCADGNMYTLNRHYKVLCAKAPSVVPPYFVEESVGWSCLATPEWAAEQDCVAYWSY